MIFDIFDIFDDIITKNIKFWSIYFIVFHCPRDILNLTYYFHSLYQEIMFKSYLLACLVKSFEINKYIGVISYKLRVSKWYKVRWPTSFFEFYTLSIGQIKFLGGCLLEMHSIKQQILKFELGWQNNDAILKK